MSDTIKPCPFCGEIPDVDNPATFRHELGDRWASIVCCIVGPEIRAGIYTPLEEWKDEAIAAWNTRTAPVEVQPVQADVWVPVTNGMYHTQGPEVIDVDDETLRIAANGEQFNLFLQDGHRLCRKRPAAEAQP